MKTVYIVTGGTGFVGNNIIKLLESKGDTVVAQARSETKAAIALANSDATIVYGTVMNERDLDALFAVHGAGMRYVVIHTAAVVYLGRNRKKVKEMFDTNISGTANVISACLKHNARLVYVSSVHAIQEAPNRGIITEVTTFDHNRVVGTYAKSKAMASQLVMDSIKNYNLDAVLVHPSGIVGPNDYSNTHLTQMVADYKDGKIPAATNGGYDFVDVRDVAQGTIEVANVGKRGDCFILSNKYFSVKEMLDTLHELGAGKRVRLKLPLWMARAGLPVIALQSKLFKKRPLYTRYSLYTLGSNSNFSNQKAREELGFSPRPLRESLKDMIN